MKPSVLGLAVLLLAACSDTNSKEPKAPQEEPREDAAVPPEEADDGSVAEPKSLLPRPPGELQRPPLDGKLPSDLRPPSAD